jgi:hypothetical protein
MCTDGRLLLSITIMSTTVSYSQGHHHSCSTLVLVGSKKYLSGILKSFAKRSLYSFKYFILLSTDSQRTDEMDPMWPNLCVLGNMLLVQQSRLVSE